MVFGVLLFLVALGVAGFGLFNHLKARRIVAAPFKTPSELSIDPSTSDPKGAISTEGRAQPLEQPLLSPCSQTPCLYYEVKVERLWEKSETSEDGTKTSKGKDTLDTIKGGALVGLTDGGGQVMVDLSKGADFDELTKGYQKELNGRSWSSQVLFGEFKYDVPALSTDKWTIGFKATEKFVPADASFFVLGKLDGDTIVKPSWRSMMVATKGREGLLGKVAKRAKFSFIGGGVTAAASVLLMIFGPSVDTSTKSSGASYFCETTLTDARAKCSARVSNVKGDELEWTVTKPGTYELEVFAPQKKVAFDPELVVTDAAGVEKGRHEGGIGKNALLKLELTAGTYRITVKPGDGYMVKGGFSYDFEIRSLTVEAPPQPVADVAGAAGGLPSNEALLARLNDLNELCGDTFCEGNFDYQFTELKCPEAATCVLAFRAKDSRTKRSYQAQVAIAGAAYPFSDDMKFTEGVGEALAEWEHHPRNVKIGASALAGGQGKPTKKVAKAGNKWR